MVLKDYLTDSQITYWGFIIGIISLIITSIGLIYTIIVFYRTKNLKSVLNTNSDATRYNSIRKGVSSSLQSQNEIICNERKVTLSNVSIIIEQITKIKGLKCISKTEKKAINYLLKEFNSLSKENLDMITKNISMIIAELDRGKGKDGY